MRKLYIAVNKSLQVLLSCGICCCLQTCKCGFNNEVIWCAHVPSLNVMGQYNYEEVIAINVSLEFVTFMLFVVVYKLVNVVVTMR